MKTAVYITTQLDMIRRIIILCKSKAMQEHNSVKNNSRIGQQKISTPQIVNSKTSHNTIASSPTGRRLQEKDVIFRTQVQQLPSLQDLKPRRARNPNRI